MMKRVLAALLALTFFAQLAAADDVNYSFSTFGGLDSVISRANTTVMFDYNATKAGATLSAQYEKLFFQNGLARVEDFYANEFSPGLNASALADKANRTYFYVRGKNYLLLDFSHATNSVLFAKESYYANNVTYACNFTVGGYTLNVSKVYRNTTALQPKRKIEFTFLGGIYANQSFEVNEGEVYRHIFTGLMLSPLSIYAGVQDNLTNASIAVFSTIYNVSSAGGDVTETVYGSNATPTGISGLLWEADGDFKGFGFDYSTVTGSGKEFQLSKDCIYTPQMICNWNLTRSIAVASTTPTALTVNCPPWPAPANESNATNATTPRYCFNNSDCAEGVDSCTSYSCTGTSNETVNLTIGNYTGNTSKTCVYSRQTGCVYEGGCAAIGFRYADSFDYWYCQENIFKKQKNGGESCGNNYECKSNSCSGTCAGYVTPTPPVYPTPPPEATATPAPTPAPTPVPECVADRDCGDGLACTGDYCVNSTCVHRPLYGCALGSECKEYGFVDLVNGALSYCSPDGAWAAQKPGGEGCRQNYECLSYSCIDLQCWVPAEAPPQGVLETVGGIFQAIIDFFLGLFK
ncbi:MAG: hypothetical protein AB1626_01850 [Candidatus Micrarchaeota archaeon]